MDITKRVQAERELEERHQYLEGLLESAPDAIVTLDENHLIVYWNPGAERLFGYSLMEVIGKNIDYLITNPGTHENAAGFTQIVVGGEKVSPTEIVCCRKDGSAVDVIAGGSPILVGGELIGAVAIYTDITERKRAEEALQNAHDNLEIRVGRRTAELQELVELMVGREVRMAELKTVVKELRAQLEEAGLEPVADDPLRQYER